MEQLKTCSGKYCFNLFLFVPKPTGGGRTKEYCERRCYSYHRHLTQRFTDPEGYKEKYTKANFSRYGITEEIYFEMLQSQNNGCAVCKTSTPGGKGRFHIDHDHACCPQKGVSCGKCIRGLLCTGCNLAAGYLHSDPVKILALLEYIEKSQLC